MSKLIRDNNKKFDGKFLFGLGIIIGIALVAFVCTLLSGRIKDLLSNRKKADLNIEIETSEIEDPTFSDVNIETSRITTPETETSEIIPTNETTINTIESSSQETNPELTTISSVESTNITSSETIGNDEVEWYLQDESVFESFIPQIVIPGREYASNRISEHPEFYTMYKGYLIGDTIDSHFYMNFYTMDDQPIGYYGFVLDGINYPDTDNTEDPCAVSFYHYLFDKIETELYVYIETDGIVDEDGNLHGYIWYDPNATVATEGTCLPTAQLTQLNEELLMLGFAEPDQEYNGIYANIYAQYPQFTDDYNGYPIVRRLVDGRTAYNDAVTFFNPSSAQLINPEYFYSEPYNVAFPE